ncbi:LysR family transcriptional regulator [Spiractinospora alimapuensis]|uniref:LysR family transcriptional regulator n=1 Tax=Spiractinospora alimapuensis TaxID=2820884 RepID=UPI001F3490C9|nr:LysR substrate-binding domain-containing protein [Spiractinospora alimapuensis]QVQ52252.1 LysR family transcriptional regulator [Spiractinospora alimapuensis]
MGDTGARDDHIGMSAAGGRELAPARSVLRHALWNACPRPSFDDVDVHTRRLWHFVTLADELHFTSAAEMLHISQQGLSRSIAELEAQVGVPLLVRTTRSVALTEAGELFLSRVRTALSALDEGTRAARATCDSFQNPLRIGFSVSSLLELNAPILSAFRARYPTVAIEQESFQYGDPSCGLYSNATDIAFVRTPIECPDLHVERMFVEPRAVGVHQDHPLATARSVTLDALVGEEILAPRTHDSAWSRFWTLRDTGLEERSLPHVGPIVGSIEAELEKVTSGEAITVTPISMSRFAPRPSIVYRPIADVAGSEMVLAWRGPRTPLIEAFRATAVEVQARERALVSRIEAATGNPEEF